MKKIKIGIIGYGPWVKKAYIPALDNDGRAKIVGISAKSTATLKSIKESFGKSLEVYSDYKKLLASPKIEAIMIAVPDSIHADTISLALESGKAIFYEPPIANTRSQVKEMMQALLAAPQITHADIELALVPAIIRASKLIKQQIIGNVQTARIRLNSNWGPDPDQDINNIDRLSVWYVHVLNVLLGSSPKRVLVMDGYGTRGRRQSQGSGFFDYNGIWGEFKVNIDSLEKLSIDVKVVGDCGDMFIDVLSGTLKIRTKRHPTWKIECLPAIQPYADWPGVHESISLFLNAVESGVPSFANATVVAGLHLIGLASEESKETGTWATVLNIDQI